MVTVDISGKLPSGFPKALAVRLMAAAYPIGGGRSPVEVSLTMVDDRTMRKLNRSHRDKDKTTDVLSFTLMEDGMPGPLPKGMTPLLGEIVVSLPQVRRQAKAIRRTIKEEFALMLVHGMLHLQGYDHGSQEDETVMFGLQHETLIREGIF